MKPTNTIYEWKNKGKMYNCRNLRIIRLRKRGRKLKEIAKEYKTSIENVCRILKRVVD